MIGLTLPLVADAYFGPMLSGAAEALYERDMRIVLGPTLHEHDREVSLLERLMRGTTDGAILMLPEESEDELRMLQRQGFPFVVVDPREPPPDGIACVAAMHACGAKQATEHLLSLGHRRIGAIAGSARLVRDRGAARSASALRSPAPGSCSIRSSSSTPTGASRAAPRRRDQLLSLADPPDRDLRLQRQRRDRRAARRSRRGVSVPDELSVIGFDDTEQAVIVAPRLTSVRQPLAELGRMGVSPADAPHRRSARRRAARRALDDARRPRVDRAATAAVQPCGSRHRGARPRRAARRRCRASASGTIAQYLRGPKLVAGGVDEPPTRTRRSSNAWGHRREPNRAVVDVERGARLEHALLRRPDASSCSRSPSTAGRPVSPTTAARGFRVSAGGVSDPARFIYACEDGKTARVDADGAARMVDPQRGGRGRGGGGGGLPRRRRRRRARVCDRLPQRARRRLRRRLAAHPARRARSRIATIPSWYAPFGVQAIGDRIYVTYVGRAPVDGNDAPTGGYVDEFDLAGRLVARVARMGALNAPWGLARAPRGFGSLRRRPARRELRRRPHQRVPPDARRLGRRRRPAQQPVEADRGQRPLGHRVRERRRGRAARHPVLHLGPARLARRDRARRARPARRDQRAVMYSVR